MNEGKELTVQKESPFEGVIRSLAENPQVDVDKLKQIMEMQEHILDRNAEQAFNAAMVRAQDEMPTVPKDRKNTQTSSMYSAYETILKYCKPIYTKYGFSIMFYEGDAKHDGEIRIMADVMHEQGHTKTRYVDVPIDSSGIKGTVNKTNTHAKGSSVSYGRSYLMRMIFNIPTGDDDDGNAASVQYITESQAADLKSVCDELKIDMKKFLSYLRVESIEKIPVGKWDAACAAADLKRKAVQK
jgi:hypothetical protein